MPFTPAEIESRNLLMNHDPKNYREIGYDLTVDEIFVPDDQDSRDWARENNRNFTTTPKDEYEIPPRGMVLVFAKESVQLPEKVCGYAMPKTSLCDEGVLVLNTGIIDPGYKGRLSGTTINFSNRPFKIKKGMKFLRLVFETSQGPSPVHKPVPPMTDEIYMKLKQSGAENFTSTFLSIRETVNQASKKFLAEEHALIQKERTQVLYIVGGTALLLTIIQVVAQVFPIYKVDEKEVAERVIRTQEKVLMDAQDTKRIAEMEKQIDEQRKVIEQLKTAIQDLKSSQDQKKK